MRRTRVLIMGAAGRDFHNFNVVFRKAPQYDVRGFTATQIPNIAGRRYPPILAGRLYPRGIPIFPEEELAGLITRHRIEVVCLAYSDLHHVEVMHRASIALAGGADFWLLGPGRTSLQSRRPVVAIGAVRTGAGKSPTSRKIAAWLQARGHRVVVIRHPMPYSDLARQACQRFETLEDLDRAGCTIEEREEYEPHLRRGIVVYAGVDYGRILRQAEREAEVIVWDGGNNDFPFLRPTLFVVVVDPHRPGHELTYHPGETNLRMADVLLVNKVDTAPREGLRQVLRHIRTANPRAPVIRARSVLRVHGSQLIRGRRVLVVEDGPTLTHGGMEYGAGVVAARRYGARSLVDPRPHAVGSLRAVYQQYPHLQRVLPAMGYSAAQIRELEQTINQAPCDVVIDASPVDLGRLLRLTKPLVEVEYEVREIGRPTLADLLQRFERQAGLRPRVRRRGAR